MPDLVCELDTPLPRALRVRDGDRLFVRGRCYHPASDLRSLTLVVGGERHLVKSHSIAAPETLEGTVALDPRGSALTSTFWASAPLRASGRVDVRLDATLDDGATASAVLGTVDASPYVRTPSVTGADVVVCVVAVDAEAGTLATRLGRLRDALPDRWALVMIDDRSMRTPLPADIAGDRRVTVIGNTSRVGAYLSVERALEAIGPDARQVVVLDPRSDAVSGGLLEPGFRRRLPDGSVVSARPPADALLASPVPSDVAFDAALLDVVLPFPPDVGIGDATVWIEAAAGDGSAAARGAPTTGRTLARDVARAPFDPAARGDVVREALNASSEVPIRLAEAALRAQTLRARASRSIRGLAALARIDRSPAAAARAPRTARNALSSLIALRLLTLWYRRRRTAIVSKHGTTDPDDQVRRVEAQLAEIESATTPLNLNVAPNAPVRTNLIVPMIDFRYVFGAYLMVFELALALSKAGRNVRLVITGDARVDDTGWRRALRAYPGLETFLDRIEITTAADRSQPVDVNARDSFVAITSWTAHIAAEAIKHVDRDRFLFLVLEYDPLVFPVGSHHEMSAAAYRRPHDAIFSTELLRKYFRSNRIGVFGHDDGDERSVAVDNPIPRHEVAAGALAARTQRSLLFYARVEDHAKRNLFEMGVLALRRLVERRGTDLDGWRIHGIGSLTGFSVPLGADRTLDVLPRTSFAEYLSTIERYDVGLALQATPHSGLVALDMASAGLVTVTNTFATKDASDITAISDNLIAAEPTVGSIADALSAAIDRSSDHASRAAGAELRWPRTWDEALDASTMQRLLEMPSMRLAGDATTSQ